MWARRRAAAAGVGAAQLSPKRPWTRGPSLPSMPRGIFGTYLEKGWEDCMFTSRAEVAREGQKAGARCSTWGPTCLFCNFDVCLWGEEVWIYTFIPSEKSGCVPGRPFINSRGPHPRIAPAELVRPAGPLDGASPHPLVCWQQHKRCAQGAPPCLPGQQQTPARVDGLLRGSVESGLTRNGRQGQRPPPLSVGESWWARHPSDFCE